MINAYPKIEAFRTQIGGDFPYYCFRPYPETVPSKILVSVHGITRNALEHATRMAPFCAQHNILLIAPYFSRDRFHHFQKLSADKQKQRPSYALDTILKDVETRTHILIEAVTLVGYSGGGQFAHRFALQYPNRIEKLILTAPGWYTMPDADRPYPEGLGPPDDLKLDIEGFAKRPITVIVGSQDTRRDKSLNRAKSIDKAQGRTRLSRAKTWVNAIKALKDDMGYQTGVALKIAENCGHDFSLNVKDRTYFDILSDEILA